mmetsp:Transcript_78038/g.91092  ORF Transcript_78038/g.91092 Transcript_78038/m.91092 type:complete len:223 (-) Transcript_78038:81-749(-)
MSPTRKPRTKRVREEPSPTPSKSRPRARSETEPPKVEPPSPTPKAPVASPTKSPPPNRRKAFGRSVKTESLASLQGNNMLLQTVVYRAIKDAETDGFHTVDTDRLYLGEGNFVRDKINVCPVFYSNHFVLAVVDIQRGLCEVYDSYRAYAHGPRKKAMDDLLQQVQKGFGTPIRLVYKHTKQQEPKSNDCGLHTINNALTVMGNSALVHDRTTLRMLMRELL